MPLFLRSSAIYLPVTGQPLVECRIIDLSLDIRQDLLVTSLPDRDTFVHVRRARPIKVSHHCPTVGQTTKYLPTKGNRP